MRNLCYNRLRTEWIIPGSASAGRAARLAGKAADTGSAATGAVLSARASASFASASADTEAEAVAIGAVLPVRASAGMPARASADTEAVRSLVAAEAVHAGHGPVLPFLSSLPPGSPCQPWQLLQTAFLHRALQTGAYALLPGASGLRTLPI